MLININTNSLTFMRVIPCLGFINENLLEIIGECVEVINSTCETVHAHYSYAQSRRK